jgi:hypothetical protein
LPPDSFDERCAIQALCAQLNAVLEDSDATPGSQTIAAIMTAARRARRTSMPATVAAAMLADYIVRGDPV